MTRTCFTFRAFGIFLLIICTSFLPHPVFSVLHHQTLELHLCLFTLTSLAPVQWGRERWGFKAREWENLAKNKGCELRKREKKKEVDNYLTHPILCLVHPIRNNKALEWTLLPFINFSMNPNISNFHCSSAFAFSPILF